MQERIGVLDSKRHFLCKKTARSLKKSTCRFKCKYSIFFVQVSIQIVITCLPEAKNMSYVFSKFLLEQASLNI